MGVNAAHRLQSPLFPDGSFEFVPIPEEPGDGGPPMVRYGDLPSFNDPSVPLIHYLPPEAAVRYTHADPEFETFTYGDNCDRSPRAVALRGMRSGDLLFFLARLVPWERGRFLGPPGFFLVGYLEITEVAQRITGPPADRVLARIGSNAHVRRSLARGVWDGFWVFCGSPASARFRRAVPVDRGLAEAVLTSAKGELWHWDGRTELQVIGSYTRTCRCVIDPATRDGRERVRRLWQAVTEANPELTAPAPAGQICARPLLREEVHEA